MKDQARVVVIGGGIMGVSVAYHLAKLGWKDVMLLEKGEIASGESGWAAGLVTQFHTSPTLMQIRKYSIELFSQFGLISHVGSLRVASVGAESGAAVLPGGDGLRWEAPRGTIRFAAAVALSADRP